jgi:hypothetical protein
LPNDFNTPSDVIAAEELVRDQVRAATRSTRSIFVQPLE